MSPLLANVYLNEFDWEYERRGVPVIRYADDIVLLCKSQRAAERLLESSIRYLEGKLKLRVNRDKSHIARVNATKNFKFLGFAYGKGKDGLFIRAHPKALLKAKNRLRAITKRNRGVNVRKVMQEIKVRMAELLRDSVPKDENAGMGRMAAAPNPCIHLEAMEETEDQTQEPHEARCAGILRIYGDNPILCVNLESSV